MAERDLFDRLAVVMAHPDDEILWASSILRRAERIILVYGDLPCDKPLSEGRKAAMAAFPLDSLDWLAMTETGIFDSASWPNPRETAYGLYPHPALGTLASFDPEGYRAQFDLLRARLLPKLTGLRNVVVHSPWGEYGHEDHVQLFRVVASLRDELGLQIWVPGYFAEKSEQLMLRHLRHLGQPTQPLLTDQALAAELSQIYMRTGTWTWFKTYVWPNTEWFFPYLPQTSTVAPGAIQRIVFPDEPGYKPHGLRWRLRAGMRRMLSWQNRQRQS
jgi:hypothetical protein